MTNIPVVGDMLEFAMQFRATNSKILFIQNLRAIAIISIVLGHVLSQNTDNFFVLTGINLARGNTALFVFISGYFLPRLYRNGRDYKKFIRKKLVNLAVPYLFLSGLILFYYLITDVNLPPLPVQNRFLSGLNSFEIALLEILRGSILSPYWYIPFILFVFILSPVYITFIKYSFRTQILVTVFLLFISSLIWRPVGNFLIIQSVIYYTPFYLFGIFFYQRESYIFPVISKYWKWYLSLLVFILLSMNAERQVGNLNKSNPFDFEGFDLMVPQKLLLILVLLFVCNKFLNKEIPVLDAIARYSFPIYFLHEIFFFLLLKNEQFHNFARHSLSSFLMGFLVLFLSFVSAVIVKAILGSKSKYFVGY